MKKTIVMLSLIGVSGVACAQDYLVPIPNEAAFGNDVKVKLNGWANTINNDLSNRTSGTVGMSTLVVSSSVTAASGTVGDMNVGTNLDFGLTSVSSVTNGQIFIASGSYMVLNNTGTASVTTTNPWVSSFAPGLVGRLVIVQGATANTDSIHIAESATLALIATNLTITANDVVGLIVAATNLAVQAWPIAVN